MATQDSKRRMGQSQDTDEEGGHVPELGNAATRMADAIVSGNAVELRAAASDHAAALGSQATAMASSIARPVYGKLEEISGSLAELKTEMRNSMRSFYKEGETRQDYLLAQLQHHFDDMGAMAKKHGEEIEALRADWRESASEVAARLGKQAEDIEGLHAGQARISTEVNELRELAAAQDVRHGGQWEEAMTLYRDEHERLNRKRKELDEHAARLAELEAFKVEVQERMARSLSEEEVREFTALLREIAAERKSHGGS